MCFSVWVPISSAKMRSSSTAGANNINIGWPHSFSHEGCLHCATLPCQHLQVKEKTFMEYEYKVCKANLTVYLKMLISDCDLISTALNMMENDKFPKMQKSLTAGANNQIV